jgi:cysteine-S-conjugate beta-lyase
VATLWSRLPLMPINPRSRFDEEIDRRAVPALKVHPLVMGADGGNLFAAGVADMDFRPPECVTRAMQTRLDHGVFGYETVPSGLMPALTTWLEHQHGWRVDQAHILRAPNILNALAIAASVFSEPGEGVIVQPPVFFDFFDILAENHRTLVSNPLILRNGRYAMDFDGLERCAARSDVKMIYLCNPHNPMGRVWPADDLRLLGDICARHGVLVVSDEMHGDLTFAGHQYTPFAALGPVYAANAVTCISPAKTFNIASCSSAFTVICDDDKRAAFQTENSRLTANKNNAFSSAAMQAAYSDGGPWLEELMTYLQGNLNLVLDRLGPLHGVRPIEPEGGFLLWLDFRGLKLDPDALSAFLRHRAGWAVTRGPVFGTQGVGFARLNIACPRARLAKALDQLSDALT